MIIQEREGIEEVVSMMNSCRILNANMPQRVIRRGRTERENESVPIIDAWSVINLMTRRSMVVDHLSFVRFVS